MRVALAQINPTVGDLEGNKKKILREIDLAKKAKVDLIVFPELCLSGYPPEDLLLLPHFIKAVEIQLEKIIPHTDNLIAMIGLPRQDPNKEKKYLFNSAAIISNGKLLGFQDKILLPTYDVFDERRYFEPGNETKLWNLAGKKIAITICEDIWQHSEYVKFTSYNFDPIKDYIHLKPDLLINLSSSPFSSTKPKTRLHVCEKAALAIGAPLLLCNQVGGNDSLIFDGYSLFVGKDGQLRQYARGFEEELLIVEPFVDSPVTSFTVDDIADIYHALILGVRDYFTKSGFHSACIGLSGGIDSALVACIAVDALGSENVYGIAMPSRYSSKESLEDAKKLAQNLKIQFSTIPIEEPFTSYLNLLHPHFENLPPDVTEENLQARIRGMILMAISNKFGHIVLSTGNKSELALGYATLYGDMCGGLAVINDLTKRQVYKLAQWTNRDKEIIPKRIILKEPSAELKPNQKDSDSLPAYEIVDTVLTEYMERHLTAEEIAKRYHYSQNLVEDLIIRIHRNEYKRRQGAPGLRISEKAFSVGRRFPIVQRWVY